MPRRLGARVARPEIAGRRVYSDAQEHYTQPVATEREMSQLDVLVDEVHAGRTANGFRLAPNEGVGELDRSKQGLGEDFRAGDGRSRPSISERAGEAHSLRSEAHVMRELDRLLFLEIGRAVDRQDGTVAKAGQAEQLTAQQPSPGAERPGAAVLNDEAGVGGQVLHGDVADHVARGSTGGPQGQSDRITGQVAREQQITFGLEAVEQGLPGEAAEIGGERGFGAACLTADADLRQMRHQYLEADHSAFDALLQYLDGGDVAGVPQDGGGAVADLAHCGDRHFAPDIRSKARRKVRVGQALQPLEIGAAEDKADRGELRPVERTGRALDPALDFKPTLGSWRRRRWTCDFLARRRDCRRGALRGGGDRMNGKKGAQQHAPAASRRVSESRQWTPFERHRGAPSPFQ